MEEDQKKMQTTEMLVSLQEIFYQQLPGKLKDIISAWQAVIGASDEDCIQAIQVLHMKAHSLAGSALTFNAQRVGKSAQVIEHTLDSLGYLVKDQSTELKKMLDSEKIHAIQLLMNQLESAVADVGRDTEGLYVEPVVAQVLSDENYNKIFLIEDDSLLARDIRDKLSLNGYEVVYFERLDDFINSSEKMNQASAIIMDMGFNDDIEAGAKAISALQDKYNVLPPVIFISARDDVHARLAAVRAAGVCRYFTKPVDMERLALTLDELSGSKLKEPYRLLVVDDDDSLGDYYATVFSQYRIDVKVLNDPMKVLEMMKYFQPELFLLDLYMPECSGLELATMIRQDDDWAQTPIMFLSSEQNMGKKLAALDLGGDDYLTKPVDPNHLLAVILARLKRSRTMNRLNSELKETLKHSEYQRTALNLHGVVSVTDPKGNITLANDMFCKVTGYDRKELIGQNHRLLKSDYHPSEFFRNLWDTISAGKVWRGIVCDRNKAGDRIWLDSTIVPFLDDQGMPYQYVAIRNDITALINAQQALRKSESDFRSIFENMQDIFYRTDTEGRIIMISPSVNRYMDNSDNQLIGQKMSDFYKDPNGRNKMLQELHDNGGSIKDYEIVFLTDDNREVSFSTSSHYFYDDKGEIAGVEGVGRDITQTKQAQQELLLAKETAENASRTKSEFLSSMSHELRTPLNAILGFSQVLTMDRTLTPQQFDDVRIIEDSGKHLLELINEILDLARIEAGRVEMSIESVSLTNVLNECEPMIKPLLDKYEIQMESISGNCGDLMVRADYIRLKQVLLNLLSNACKYNRRGGRLTINCDSSVDEVRIKVNDTGHGLSVEQQAKLFTSFERLDAGNTDIEGTGIGLVIARQLIELMGGQVGVESEQGIGSTFWVDLCRADDSLTVNNSASDDDIKNSVFANEKTYTILYIEDNPANLKLISRLLSKRPNVNLITAHEPYLGIELAGARSPDLILLDINLPGINGFEVLERLRANEAIREIPVIAVSANAMKKDIEMADAAGFNGYITKPIEIDKFNAAIDSVINI